MVFSFFKKKGDGTAKPTEPELKRPEVKRPQGAAPSPDVRAPAAAAPAELEAPESLGLPDTRAFVLPDLAPEDVTVLEEVAVLFANEQIEAAASVLESQVLGDTRCDEELWLMLFELYQLKGDRAAFDELALKFVVAFERSAPIWHAATVSDDQPGKAAVNVCMLPAALTGEHCADALRDAGAKPIPLRLDASRVSAIDDVGAACLADRLRALRKSKASVEWVALDALLDRLRGRIEVTRADAADQPYWALLLEGLQWGGDEAAFEAAAIDYAVTYEVSPPSWEPPRARPAKGPAQAVAPEPNGEVDAFVMPRVVTAANDGELDRITPFGEGRQTVALECQGLERMDFVAGGRLLNLLIQQQQQGKDVQLKHVSHLVAALLRVLGIHEFARITYRK